MGATLPNDNDDIWNGDAWVDTAAKAADNDDLRVTRECDYNIGIVCAVDKDHRLLAMSEFLIAFGCNAQIDLYVHAQHQVIGYLA